MEAAVKGLILETLKMMEAIKFHSYFLSSFSRPMKLLEALKIREASQFQGISTVLLALYAY